MLRKCWVRGRNGAPISELQHVAWHGFWERGVELELFEAPLEELPELRDLGPDVGISGYIFDVKEALRRLEKPLPELPDYPTELHPFLGRRVWQGTVREALDRWEQGERLFVKSLSQKAVTGFKMTGEYRDKIKLAGLPDDESVLFSDPVEFVSEYRSFVLRGEVLDVRRYKGDWSKAPHRETVEAAVAAWPTAPAAYALDVGVTDDGRTLLVEVNDGYALGSYGLLPNFYAQMIEARWEELVV